MDKKEKAKQIKIETLYKGELRSAGSEKLTGMCPFHASTDRKDPNFIIFTNTNTWYCFATKCKFGGDAIAFYMKLFNTDFKTAIKKLAKT